MRARLHKAQKTPSVLGGQPPQNVSQACGRRHVDGQVKSARNKKPNSHCDEKKWRHHRRASGDCQSGKWSGRRSGRHPAGIPGETGLANTKLQVVRKAATGEHPAAPNTPQRGRDNDDVGIGGVGQAIDRSAATDGSPIKESPPGILNNALGRIRTRRDAEGPETRISGHLI